jgi:L-lactate dehydrogenase
MDNGRQCFERIVIIGAGRVGSTCAYALLLQRLASEIVLICDNPEHAEGEAMDLNHGILFARPVRIWSGSYADCAGAGIIVLAAGVSQQTGETRMDLLKRNAALFQKIVPQVVQYARDAILIIVTNPVDVLTYITWKISGLSSSQVIGIGTILDTARFRYLLSQHYHVEPRSVHAFVIGEHGDSQVVVWSLANIAGIRLEDYGHLNGGELDLETKVNIARETRNAAYEVISRKGATFYAISAGVVRIVEAITRNEDSVLTVSSPLGGIYGFKDVSLSLPSVVNREGISHILKLPLSQNEHKALERSAQSIRSAIESISVSRANLDALTFIG